MPRPIRYAQPGQPQHVVQRGNNRIAIFHSEKDFVFFRECLHDALTKFKCELHAYVLMSNHVHLLMSPGTEHGIARALQSVGRRYVRRFNGLYGRTGTLWEGRYRATIVDAEAYLFRCYRYIELNPVRAGVVAHAADYRWSSFAANALGGDDALITPHERFVALGGSPETRRAAYRALFQATFDEDELRTIRKATNSALPLDNERLQYFGAREDIRRVATKAAIR
jgi:putative transposase